MLYTPSIAALLENQLKSAFIFLQEGFWLNPEEKAALLKEAAQQRRLDEVLMNIEQTFTRYHQNMNLLPNDKPLSSPSLSSHSIFISSSSTTPELTRNHTKTLN